MDGRWLRIGFVVTLIPGCSVGDIEDASPFGESQSVPDDSGDGGTGGSTGAITGVSANATDPSAGTGDSLTDSGPDPTAPGTTSGTEESSGTGTAGESSDGSDSTSSVACGNGIIEGDEACDGADLGGLACPDVGDFVGGTLACDAACAFDTSACTVPMDPIEVCQAINLAIPDAGSAVSTVVAVPSGGTIADVTLGVDITHTWIGDLRVDVEHNGISVTLYNQGCGNVDNMSLQFSDAGAAINCAASTSGAATLPVGALSAFDGTDASGNWTFSFQDNASADTGSATGVCVQVTF